jgi:hypothetical protein
MSTNENDLAIKKVTSKNAYDRQADMLAQSGKMYVPGRGIMDIPQDGSSGTELNSRGNRNERIQSSIKEGFDAGAAGSASGNALIKQAQSSSNSNNGGSGAGNNNQQPTDTHVKAQAIKSSQDVKNPVLVSFGSVSGELKMAQTRLLEQTQNRLGITLNPEDIQGMDIADIDMAIKALATRTRPTEKNPAVESFFASNIPVRDFFDPIDPSQQAIT